MDAPPSYVKLISADGYEFVVRRCALLLCPSGAPARNAQRAARGHVCNWLTRGAPQVDRRAAAVSKTIANLLSSEGAPGGSHTAKRALTPDTRRCAGGFAESALGEVRFPHIEPHVLEMVVKFMLYKWKLTTTCVARRLSVCRGTVFTRASQPG